MRKQFARWCSIWILLCNSLTLYAAAQPLEIVNGDRIAVVTAPNAVDTVNLAASDLQRILAESLGVEIDMLDHLPDESDYAAIFAIGSRVAPEYLEMSALEREEYWIDVAGNTVFLGGNDAAGNPLAPYFPVSTPSYYAVARFLTDELGVRWLFPGDQGEIIPKHQQLSIGERSERQSPSYPIRMTHYAFAHLYGGAERNALVLWGRRNGMGTKFSGNSGHAESRIVGQRYFETNPEYYALINGERTNLTKYGKLCHSNPDLPQVWVEYAAQSELGSVSTSANDGRGWCECEACIELDGPDRIRANGTPITSGRMFTFTNRVAKALQDADIDKPVFIYAYADYVEPPQTVAELEPNVVIFLARDLKTLTRSETSRKLVHQKATDWAQLAKGIAIRDYWGVYSPTVVNSVPHIYIRELEYFGQFDWFKGISTSGDDSRDWALTGPAKYVAANLLWDATADPDQLLEQWYHSGWPASHQQIRAYYELFQNALDAHFASGQADSVNYLSLPMQNVETVYTEDLLDQAEALLNLADQIASDPDERRRIEFVRIGLEATRVEREYLVAVGSLAAAGVPLNRYTISETESVSTAERQRRIQAAATAGERRLAFHHKHQSSMAIPSVPLVQDSKYAGSWMPIINRLLEMEVEADTGIIPVGDPWRFQLDPATVGVAEGWANSEFDDSAWDWINTNDFWENQGYGPDTDPQGRPDGYNGIAWYRREISIPQLYEQQQTLFCIGSADESFVFYINGQQVASHIYDASVDPDSWRTPHWIDITDYCIPGETVQIAIQVQDLRGYGGIWQPCYLEIRSTDQLTAHQSNQRSTWSTGPSGVEVFEETDTSNQSYLVVNTMEADTLPARLVTRVSGIKPDTTYRIQGSFRATQWDGVRNNRRQINPIGLRITYADSDKRTIDQDNAPYFFTSPPDGPWTADNWIHFSEVLNTPNSSVIAGANLTIWVRYHGIFDLRDIRITQISPD